MNNDDFIATLMGISGCSATKAKEVLTKVDWDLNQATDILLSNTEQIIPDYHQASRGARDGQTPKQIIYQDNFDIPTYQENEVHVSHDNFVLQQNIQFKKAKEVANNSNRWLIVMVLEHVPQINPFMQDSVVDLFQINFVGLILTLDSPEGEWFKTTYEITISPAMVAVDPVTGLLVDKQLALFGQSLRQYLEEFLCSNPQKGLSQQTEAEIEYFQEAQLRKAIEESLKTKLEEDEKHKEEEEQAEEIGEPITMMVQLPNGKRSKISIGSESKVLLLYKKISIISEIDIDKFELKVSFPPLLLDDKKKIIKDCNLKGCLLNLIEI